jgi:tetratricopeptide (TPR) repeat protein
VLAAALVVAALAVLGVWWAKRAPHLPSGERGPAPATAPALAAAPERPNAGGDATLERVLERGALLERESGVPAALAFYEDAASKTARTESRAVLLSTIADLAVKTQDKSRALKALEALIEIPASHGSDPDVTVRATLRLARVAGRAQNALRATTLYEEILLKAPASPQANEARLGLAALYGAAGRLSDARRLYEEVLRSAAPASDAHKAAEAGMKALESAPAVENRG